MCREKWCEGKEKMNVWVWNGKKMMRCRLCFFFFNDTATTEIYTLSLHDALPISLGNQRHELEATDEEGNGNN